MTEIPFHIGHQSSDETCFTRNSSDEIGLIRVHDEVLLNGSLLKPGNQLNLEMKFILHYPGQLIEKIETPLHRIILKEMHSKRDDDQMFWEGKIAKVSVLKNRPDASPPCYDGVFSDDARFRQKVINKVGCVPIYWKNLEFDSTEMEICKSSNDLRKLQVIISSDKDIFPLNGRSCIVMDNLAFRTNEYKSDGNHITIKVAYLEYTYQETENIQDFPFESFFSSLGGFIGISLVYSMLQIPELLNDIPSVAKRFEVSTTIGMILLI